MSYIKNLCLCVITGSVLSGSCTSDSQFLKAPRSTDVNIGALPDPKLPDVLSTQYKNNFDKNPERTAKRFLREFERMSSTGAVTEKVILNFVKQEHAQVRAMVIAEMLTRDLDGNGRLTKDELVWFANNSSRYGSFGLSVDTLSADLNADGELSLSEIIEHSRLAPQMKQFRGTSSPISYFMIFDSDKDGTVDGTEMADALAPYMSDSGALDTMSRKAEITAAKLKKRGVEKKRVLNLGKNCDMPAASKNAEIIVLGGYESDTFSSVAVAGQGTATYATNITIEPGKSDLFLIATSYQPMVWVIDGNVERVKTFVAQEARSSGEATSNVAISGLSKNKIHYIERSCFPYRSESGSKDELLIKGKISNLLGRELDHLVSKYKLGQVSLPSGKFMETPKRRIRSLQSAPDRSFGAYPVKNDVLQIPIKDLKSKTILENYKVLPGRAGLQQLIAEGKIVALKDRSYHIVKPIDAFPARLTGGNSVSFVLGKGIPMPEGSAGHSKIYSEETGEIIKRR